METDAKGRFTLWWRSPPIQNSRGILKFDWPRATLLSSGGLHYSQDSFGGELCTWMKQWHGFQRGGHFFEGSSPEVKFLGQPQSLIPRPHLKYQQLYQPKIPANLQPTTSANINPGHVFPGEYVEMVFLASGTAVILGVALVSDKNLTSGEFQLE